MERKIILVSGYCATGKSTFSRELSEKLKIPCFIKDTIKETLGENFGPENNLVFKKGSTTTFYLMLYIAERFLQVGKICILEGNFKLHEIEKISELLQKYDSKCLTFSFKGDFDILFNRYVERQISEKRHWVHQTAGENAENFRNGHQKSGMGEASIGETISIDATSFKNIDYEHLFSVAKKFINGAS